MVSDILAQAALEGIHKTTSDHAEIRGWVEGRGGRPIRLELTDPQHPGNDLGIDFSGRDDIGSARVISWEEFFSLFEARKLAFVYQIEGKHGEEGLFNTFIERDKIKQGSRDRGQQRTSRSTRGAEKSKHPDRKQ